MTPSALTCNVSPQILCGSAGLCGGSASGKTTVANKIIEALDVPWVVLLSMDSFYKVTVALLFLSLGFLMTPVSPDMRGDELINHNINMLHA